MLKNGKGQKLKVGKLDKEIGFLLLDRRKRANLKQDDVANQIGVTLQSYQSYERGQNKVSPSMLHNIFDVFQMSNEDRAKFWEKVNEAHSKNNK